MKKFFFISIFFFLLLQNFHGRKVQNLVLGTEKRVKKSEQINEKPIKFKPFINAFKQ